MIVIISLIAIIAFCDLGTNWVTPYLEGVERERGEMAAVVEALTILEESK